MSGNHGGGVPPFTVEQQVEAYWAKVDKGGPDGCWIWTGGIQSAGRGTFRWRGKQRLAYRVAWELAHGTPPPDGLFVCHHCDNGLCVNPDHLFVGTHLDNMRDMHEKGRGSEPPHPRGQEHPLVFVSDELVREARESYAAGREYQHEIASRLGVAQAVVGAWVRGETRREAGGPVSPGKPRGGTHCHAGHEYTPENLRLEQLADGRVKRACRACGREARRRYLARRQGAVA